MDFLGAASIASIKIIAMKMRQNLGHFGTKRVKTRMNCIWKNFLDRLLCMYASLKMAPFI